MMDTIARVSLLATILILIGIAVGCQEHPVDPGHSENAVSERTFSDTDSPGVLSKGGPPMSATVTFGRHNVGSPFPPPEEHDASTHAQDALQPRTVVISARGEVTFEVGQFHKIAIYEPGTSPSDIDVTSTEPSGAPFPFPPVINDPTNRIANGSLNLTPGHLDFTHTFTEPGRYLVICEVLPHFADNDMYGWVIVK